ncbi:sigma D regulator [Marinobacter changyiensis]|uniref:sigma D regulator n=1 Tax=Marinobacter changyiensis TaxID=2604091 RepID=UPI001264B146|nr:sigma D regulator [Marinobacter changyiensis]
MLENCHNARERWGGVSDLIDRWLKDRQQLIVHYMDISSVDEAARGDASLNERFTQLCEVLLDYVSAGHFEIYEQLITEAKEFDDGGIELAAKVYPRIEKTTEVALNFNDKLDGGQLDKDSLASLFDELSRLGENLETRFELEDFLIEHLHTVHGEKVMSSA